MSDKNEDRINFIRLILRSKNVGGGWRLISKQLSNFVHGVATSYMVDLCEWEPSFGEGGRIRITSEGLILIKYLLPEHYVAALAEREGE